MTDKNFDLTIIVIMILIILLIFINILRFFKNRCDNLRFFNEPLIIPQNIPTSQSEENINMVLLNNDQLKDLKELNINNCPVCFDKIENNAIKTPCNHYFHQECLDEWIVKNINKSIQNCPICRFEFSINNNNIEFPVEIDVT